METFRPLENAFLYYVSTFPWIYLSGHPSQWAWTFWSFRPASLTYHVEACRLHLSLCLRSVSADAPCSTHQLENTPIIFTFSLVNKITTNVVFKFSVHANPRVVCSLNGQFSFLDLIILSQAPFLSILDIPCCSPFQSRISDMSFFNPGSKMSTEAQRVDDSPSTSGGSSDGDQRESVQQEPEREQVQPKKKEGKISSKTAAKLSTSAKR